MTKKCVVYYVNRFAGTSSWVHSRWYIIFRFVFVTCVDDNSRDGPVYLQIHRGAAFCVFIEGTGYKFMMTRGGGGGQEDWKVGFRQECC